MAAFAFSAVACRCLGRALPGVYGRPVSLAGLGFSLGGYMHHEAEWFAGWEDENALEVYVWDEPFRPF